MGSSQIYILAKPRFQEFLDQLIGQGFQIIGPTIRDQAIMFDSIDSVDQLPRGWHDQQEGGYYRLQEGQTEGWFEFVVGPNSIKNFTFPPRQTLLTGKQQQDGNWEFSEPVDSPAQLALLGARACDLAALAIQDRIFLGSDYQDPAYAARRSNLLLIGVNCQRSAPTCFCASMNCGPAIRENFDLALTELTDSFLVEVGSLRGAAVIAGLSLPEASAELIEQAAEQVRELAEQLAAPPVRQTSPSPNGQLPVIAGNQTDSGSSDGSPSHRKLNTENIRDLLYSNLNHPRWEEVAERCLSCGNCTMVCPTCFCSTVEDVPSLDEQEIRRERTWASCFTEDHSYLNSGVVRKSVSSRYRQWLTHKLGGWIDQFGTSGCVGCGRCITWCPVGIDLTEEVAAIRDQPGKKP
jgi:sulfhydrogenase subunit beta (sulfur reductase)